MPGPCPNGQPTTEVHKRCQERERCTGPGCRVRRQPYVHHRPELTEAEQAD